MITEKVKIECKKMQSCSMWKSEIEGLWPTFIWVDWVAADAHKIKNEQILKYNVSNVKLRRSL